MTSDFNPSNDALIYYWIEVYFKLCTVWPLLCLVVVWHQWTWWRHQMETFSVLLALCVRNSPVTGEFPSQRPVTWSFDVFFDLCLNKRLSKPSWGWWFETPPWSLWHHCNDLPISNSSTVYLLEYVHVCCGLFWGVCISWAVDFSCKSLSGKLTKKDWVTPILDFLPSLYSLLIALKSNDKVLVIYHNRELGPFPYQIRFLS